MDGKPLKMKRVSSVVLFIMLYSSATFISAVRAKKCKCKIVKAILEQFPELQVKLQALRDDVNELKDLKQNNETLRMLEEAVQALTEESQVEKRQFDSLSARVNGLENNFEEVQTESFTLVENIKQSLEEKKLKILENNEDITDVNTTLIGVTHSTNYLLNAVETINRCLGTRCSTDQKKLFKAPSFISSWFHMRSNDPELSELAIEHGLNELPVKVDVQIKSVSGGENDWIFTGDSVFQGDDDTGKTYGGVVYFYNETHVILRVPTIANNDGRGYVVYTGNKDGFFAGSHQFIYSEGLVRVKVWLQEDFPHPAYASEWYPLDITDRKKSFRTIRHGLSKYPAFVVVQVRANNLTSEGMGSTIGSFTNWCNAGGVLYGYDDKMVRIWTAYVPDTFLRYSFGRLFGGRDGWGLTGFGQLLDGEFRILVWSEDSFDNSNFHRKESNVEEVDTGALSAPSIDIDNDLVAFSVQALDGANKGFLFKGWGSSQATRRPFGGAIYAYNKQGLFQVWRPNAENEGYLVSIHAPYGAGSNIQASNSASYVATLLQADTI